MKQTKLIIAIFIYLLLLMGGCTEGEPELNVSPSELDLGPQLNQAQLYIKNSGSDDGVLKSGVKDLEYTISSEQSWIFVSPHSGRCNKDENDIINVSIDRNNMVYGTNNGVIDISSNAGKKKIPLIAIKAIPPKISSSKDSLVFRVEQYGSLPANQYFTIKNIGGGTLNWSISKNEDWFYVSPASRNSNNQTIRVSIKSTDLPVGEYNDNIVILSSNAENSPQFVKIKLVIAIAPPVLALNLDSLEFHALRNDILPNMQYFIISNIGAGVLEWSVLCDTPWIDFNPISGNTNNDTIFVSMNTTDLISDTYYANIVILDNNAENSPQHIVISYLIEEPQPCIGLDKDSLEFTAFQFGALPDTQSFIINNCGGGILHWEAFEYTNFMSLNPTAGISNLDTVFVSINSTNLAPGNHEATIYIKDDSASNNHQEIDVSYVVNEPFAHIVLSDTILNFSAIQYGPIPLNQSFYITNGGYNILDWYIEDNGTVWLDQDPLEGSVLFPNMVNVNVNTSNMDPGIYNADINVFCDNADNSPQVVEVVYAITAPCNIEITAPMSEDNWTIGSDQTIVWNSTPECGAYVAIDLYKGGVKQGTIESSFDNSGTYSWCVNDFGGKTGSDYQIIITDDMHENYASEFFTITTLDPHMEVNVTELNFTAVHNGDWPDPQYVTISNTGGGILDFNIESSSYWLKVNPSSGSNNDATIKVSVNWTTLGIDTHESSITISSPNADNDESIVIPVYYEITPAPPEIGLNWIEIYITAVQNGSLPAGREFEISNRGDGTLNWSVSKDVDWFDLTPPTEGNSNLHTGELVINTTNLSVGEHFGNMIVTSDNAINSPQKVLIKYTIEAQDCNIIITNPANNDLWTEETTEYIEWNPTGQCGSDVRIELYKGTEREGVITPTTENDGSYEWYVDDLGGGEGNDYRILVWDIDTGEKYFSDYFTIIYAEEMFAKTATADTYIRSYFPDENYGTQNIVDFLTITDQRVALLKFDISSVPSGVNVSKAYLNLNVSMPGAPGTAIILPVISSDWNEYTITWRNQVSGGAPTIEEPIKTDEGVWQIEITDIVEEWIENGLSNYGIMLYASQGACRFTSKEEGHPAALFIYYK